MCYSYIIYYGSNKYYDDDKNSLSVWTAIIVLMYHVALGPNNAKEVLNLMWDYRSRWKFVGIELGIDVSTLDAIDKDYRKADDCLTELITKWLRRTNPKPTRSAIAKALESQSVVASVATPSEGKIVIILV